MKRKYPFAIIEQLVKELAGEDMNEKINVLGVNIDSFTAKEAMKETIAFLESEPVSVIDVVSVDALMQMNDLPELKEKMNEFDMILPGEKLILEAAEEPELPEEINMELYLKMFLSAGRVRRRRAGGIPVSAEGI